MKRFCLVTLVYRQCVDSPIVFKKCPCLRFNACAKSENVQVIGVEYVVKLYK